MRFIYQVVIEAKSGIEAQDTMQGLMYAMPEIKSIKATGIEAETREMAPDYLDAQVVS